MTNSGARAVRWLEGLLWLTAIVALGYSVLPYARAHSLLRQPLLVRRPVAAPSIDIPAGATLPPANPAPGTLIARMSIPALHLRVPVLEDDESESLQRGVGHIASTAMPGGLGTVGIAGHRDTFLRPLSRIVPKMEVRLAGAAGVYRYQVDSTEIVSPDAVRVLETAQQPALVIVTCYPFHYIGAAPLRFIVHAHLVSLLPEPLPN